jgi:Cu(I)/Ag(I) efflux system membrane fusion protein
MHPGYRSNKPGNCPICYMTLVPLESAHASRGSAVEGRAPVSLDAGQRQMIGMRTGPVESVDFATAIRAAGRVEADERALASITTKVGGWIEQLFVGATGVEVHKGDALFSIYSPDLIEAERNYLLTIQDSGAAGTESAPSPFAETQRSARERLVALDLTDEQIRALEAKKEAPRLTTLYSKFDGVVMKRNVASGARIEAGATLYDLVDLSRVWVTASVYESEAPLLREGLDAEIELPGASGAALRGKVGFIYPMLDDATRTLRARIEVANPDRALRPGMFATVAILVDLGKQLVIDDEAILDTGTRQLVFVDRENGPLEPREVKVGFRRGGRAVIRSGLAAGERVVTSAAFLVDSESRLRASLEGAAPSHGAHPAEHSHR